jgi:hypothetical protein
VPASRTVTRPLIVAALSSLVVVAACTSSTPSTPAAASPSAVATEAPASPAASPAATPPASEKPSSADAATLLLEVTTEGGFINPVATLSSVPAVVVDSDGKIYTPGVAAGDGGVVTPIEVRDVGPEGATAILAALRAAGLDRQEEATGIAADTGTTVFTAVIDGDQVVNRFVRSGAGGPGQPGGAGGEGLGGGTNGGTNGGGTAGGGTGGGYGGGTGGDQPSPACSACPDPAAAAFDLLTRLADPNVAWAGSAPTPAPYTPAGYRVYVAPVGTDAAGTRVAWPLPTALAGFGRPAVPDYGVEGLRTGVVTGDDAVALGKTLASAPPDTLLTSNGTWSVWARPLFPDELGG